MHGWGIRITLEFGTVLNVERNYGLLGIIRVGIGNAQLAVHIRDKELYLTLTSLLLLRTRNLSPPTPQFTHSFRKIMQLDTPVISLKMPEGCVSYRLDSDDRNPEEGGCLAGRVCTTPA